MNSVIIFSLGISPLPLWPIPRRAALLGGAQNLVLELARNSPDGAPNSNAKRRAEQATLFEFIGQSAAHCGVLCFQMVNVEWSKLV